MIVEVPAISAKLSLTKAALLFYGMLLLVAFGGAWLMGWPPSSLLVLGPTSATKALAGLTLGLLLALLVVYLSRLSLRFAWGRLLSEWFRAILGPLGVGDCLLLAVASSVAEEIFFRGLLQRLIGLYAGALLFGLVHWPPRWRLWPWTAAAIVLGLVFGYLSEKTGNLAGAILAHLLINLLNLIHLSRDATGK